MTQILNTPQFYHELYTIYVPSYMYLQTHKKPQNINKKTEVLFV